MVEPPSPATTRPTIRRRALAKAPATLYRRGFRQLAGAWVFTNLADSALYLMVAVWVKELTGSDGAAALVFAVLGLPALLAPFIGQLADRVSRKRLLVATNLAMAPVLLLLVLVRGPDQLWLVYAVTFVYGATGYLTAAAQSGIIRDLLPDEELASGNGLLSTIDQALRLLSPLLGTALYVAVGPRAVVGLTAACFVVTAGLLSRLELQETPPAAAADRGGYWVELSAGFRHLARNPVLRPLTVALAVGFGATGLVNVTIFPVMEQGLGLDPSALGVLVSLQGVGAVVGGMTAAWCIRRLGEQSAMGLGLLLLAVGMLPLVGGSLPAVVVGLLVAGASVPWVLVASVTMRHRLTPPTLQGRTSAAANVAINLPQTLVTVLAAAVIGVVDYRVLIVLSIAVLVGAAHLARSARTAPVRPGDRDEPVAG